MLSCSDRVLGAVLAAGFINSYCRWAISRRANTAQQLPVVGEFVVTDLSRHPNPRRGACGCAVVWLFIECSRSVASKPVPLVFTLALVASTSFKFFVKSCLIDD